MAPKKQPNAPRTNDEALTPVATYSARGNQTIVRKSNDLIQNAMYSLTLSQQKLMLHIFAMIKPSDTELPRITTGDHGCYSQHKLPQKIFLLCDSGRRKLERIFKILEMCAG